jgi:hypothetical protein
MEFRGRSSTTPGHLKFQSPGHLWGSLRAVSLSTDNDALANALIDYFNCVTPVLPAICFADRSYRESDPEKGGS